MPKAVASGSIPCAGEGSGLADGVFDGISPAGCRQVVKVHQPQRGVLSPAGSQWVRGR